jgi:hypothetical protein
MRDWAAGRYEIPDLKKMRKSQGWACAICSYVPPVRLFEFLPEDHGDFYELKPYTYNASVERERAAEVKSLSAARNDVLVAYSLEPGNIGDWTDWIDSLSVVRYETETEHILRPGDPRKRSDLVGDSLGPVVFLKDIDDNLKLNPADTNEGRP